MKKILFLFILMFSVYLSSATLLNYTYTCYQSQANGSTSNDGNCGLNYSGIYNTTGAWYYSGVERAYRLYDANFGTYAAPDCSLPSTCNATLYINYSIPSNSSSGKWRTKGSLLATPPEVNSTIPTACFNKTKSILELKVFSTYTPADTYENSFIDWFCKNETDWQLVLIQVSYSDYVKSVYEEAIYWNISINGENSQTFNPITSESSLETFSINLSYNSADYLVITANLNYNGTNYAGTMTGSGDNVIFSKTLNIPSVTSSVNNSFYWIIAMTNTTGTFYFNSTFNNQTVNPISLGDCSATLTTRTLNISAYNEITLNRVNPFDLKGTLTYSSSIGGTQKSYSFTNLSIADKSICINVNTTYYLSGYLEYSNTSFQTKNYYFLDYPLNNVTKNLYLYMLPSSESTSFILQVQDTSALPLANYYISIFRYDAGNDTPYLVQTVQTDINGQSVAFLEVETVYYMFEIFDTNGNLVYVSSKQKAIPQSTPYTITFTVGSNLPNPLSYMNNLTGLTYSLSYDKPTFKVTFTYSDTNTSFNMANLSVYKTNSSGNDKLICYSNKTDSSGVLICDLTGNSSGSYYAVAYIKRATENFIDRVVFEIETFSDTVGLLGVFGGWIIILISAFAFAYNEVAGIVGINASIIMVNLIGLVHFGGIYITAIIGVSILLLIVLERG